MMAGPFRALIAIDSCTVRTTFSEGNFSSEPPLATICSASVSKHSRWPAEHVVYIGRHRAVEKCGHYGNPLLAEQPGKVIDHLLGPFDGEDGHDQLSAAAHGFQHHLLELRLNGLVVVVQPVAVGRFHYHIVGLGKDRRVADDRSVHLAQVAGENDPRRAFPAGHAQLDHCRAEDVPGVVKNGVDVVAQPYRPAIGSRRQKRQHAVYVLGSVQGLDGLGVSAAFAAVAFLLERRVFSLNLRRVTQHQLHQIGRSRGSVDRPSESIPHQFGAKPQ